MNRGGFFVMHGGGGPHVIGILFAIAFLIAVAAFVVLVVRWLRVGAAHVPAVAAVAGSAQPDAALAAARMRYARGELSREDFLRISSDLQEHPPAATGI